MSLSGIDVRVVVHELSKTIVGSWITNIYQLPNRIFIFKLRKPEVGSQFLLIEPGKRMHLTQFNRTMPKSPPNYCVVLRSHLRDKRVNSVEQRDLDRIIVLNIGPDEGYEIIIELFGNGNLILVSPVRKILSALTYRKMRDRDIHPGRDFVHMPSQGRDILRNGFDNLSTVIADHPKIVNVLNGWMGLGPAYSRYVLKMAEITTKKTKEISPSDIVNIEKQAEIIYNRIDQHQYEPVVYLDEGATELNLSNDEVVDDDSIPQEDILYEDQWDSLKFSPENVIKILPWKQMERDDEISTYTPETFGAAIDIYYSSQESQEKFEEDTVELKSEVDKYVKLLNQQTEERDKQIIVAEKNQIFGDLLYNNFQPGDELITTVYEARRKNMEWETIAEKLDLGKEKKIPSAMIFQELLPKQAKLVMNLAMEGIEESVIVDFRKSLTDNANSYYEQSKKAKRKIKGADKAIENTNQKIILAKEKKEVSVETSGAKVILLKRRKAWYEKFHWTESEEEFLVVAGTDATTNEHIVKRYVDADDVFLHADVQGAASTVIKGGGRKIPDNTIKTAARMAVSFSSAWKAKRIIANAFYVNPDQISLSAPSGEYLPKGSVMIYGEKQFVRDVELSIYLCLIIERNWVRVISLFTEPTKKYEKWVKLVPGDGPRGTVSKQIKNKFMNNLDPLDIQKVKALDLGEIAWLLPGDCKIEEWKD
ncbi:MAG: fibronectin-binding domain-containing protein [Candidatus Heimdallarchaeota archaeon]|nr:fibronectin-binding domain-containing protein [Candidatus Heimdallarchaeota archaeon]